MMCDLHYRHLPLKCDLLHLHLPFKCDLHHLHLPLMCDLHHHHLPPYVLFILLVKLHCTNSIYNIYLRILSLFQEGFHNVTIQYLAPTLELGGRKEICDC